MKVPTLADATTDLANPPVFVALVDIRNAEAQNPLEYRAGDAVELQLEYFPNLKTETFDSSVESVIAAAEQAVHQMNLEMSESVPEEGRLEATATTFWFGFKDDVVVRAVSDTSGKTKVDIRSASRVGYLDGGVNATRVAKMLELIQQNLES